MYFDGDGMEPNYVQAYMWYNLADEQGVKYAREFRDTVADSMTPEQIAEAQRLVREWRAK